MQNFSQHSINHFFKIKVEQLKFNELYLKYKNLINENKLTNEKKVELKIFNKFNIPKNSSNKIKKLLEEINSLPVVCIEEYSNLISHQLRTILSLIVIEYWESINKKILPQNEKNSLKRLIVYTISNARNENLKNARQIEQELDEIKGSKIKDLADDVVHCNYTLVNEKDIDKFINHIRHLLSLLYGR